MQLPCSSSVLRGVYRNKKGCQCKRIHAIVALELPEGLKEGDCNGYCSAQPVEAQVNVSAQRKQ